jgi:Uma2 family endonuclease
VTVQVVSGRQTRVTLAQTSAALPSDATIITGEELFELGDIGRAELVKGELVRMAPAGHPHGYIEVNFAAALHTFVRRHKLGRVLSGEVGLYTGRDPDTVRGADVAFISNERLAQVQSQSYLDVAPELIVEVMSPDDRWYDVNDKLTEYFDVGVQMVWVADPQRRQVRVYRSLTEIKILGAEDTLSGGEVLPGFGVAVAELFK